MSEITNLLNTIKKTAWVRPHPKGLVIIGIFIMSTIVFWVLSCTLGWIATVLTLWCFYFFRDPDRYTPTRSGLIVSTGDGVVSMIEKAALPPEIEPGSADDDSLFSEEELTRVSVFLSVFDVHVNRVPTDGKITQVIYHPGKFFNASLDKASIHNERSTVLMRPEKGKGSIVFVQIAGLIARRIINELKADQDVKAGERYGIIRFGSRVDIYLPPGVEPLVTVGQRVIGGETVIADLVGKEKQRTAEVR